MTNPRPPARGSTSLGPYTREGTTASIRCGPGSASALRSWVTNSSAVVARVGGHPHAARQGDEVERWTRQAHHVVGLGASGPGANALVLDPQDRVSAIIQNDGGDVEPLAGDRPQRLRRVHGAAVGLEADDLAIRTGHGGADRDGDAIADRAAGEHEPVVARRACGGAMEEEPGGVGLVGHDRVLRHQGAERARQGLDGERAGRQLGAAVR